MTGQPRIIRNHEGASAAGFGAGFGNQRGHIVAYHTVFVSCLAIAVAGLASEQAQAQQTPATPDQRAGETSESAVPPGEAELPKTRTTRSENADDADKEIEVTGSRLKNGNVTGRVQVITEAEIRARGVTSVEELIRTLPQNLATIGTLTNERTRSPLTTRNAPVSALGQLGVAAANLGGIGAGNTLILINGRRIAGAAGIEDGFANLNGIPISAIARVEISQDGASAIYGADAMGGVINFILKSDFRGLTLSAQHLNSNNDADVTRLSAFSGVGWGSGNVTGTLGYDRRSPVNNRKSGYVTQNYSSYYDGDPFFDKRSFSRGLQPGVIVPLPSFVFNPATGNYVVTERAFTVRPGLTGRPQISDFIAADPNSKRDYIAELAGPKVETFSGTLNLNQSITDRLTFFANGLYNRSTNREVQNFGRGLSIKLAPGQYYNPFPAKYFDNSTIAENVYYFPEAEIASGELEIGTASNTQTSWNVNAGLSYRFNRDTKLDLIYTTSSSKSSGTARNFDNVVSFIADTKSPSGIRCSNSQLESSSSRLSAEQRAALQVVFDRQCRALTSADPNIAFNPFKSTPTGGGASVSEFFYLQNQERRDSRLELYEARLAGALFTLPAGKLQYAVGGEYSDDGVNSSEVDFLTGGAGNRTRHAVFGEMTLPVLGNGFDIPLVKALTFNIAARYDAYETEGAVGLVNNIPLDKGGELILGTNRFSRTTPAFGVRLETIAGLTLRGRWTEGFRAPPYTQLFNQAGSFTARTGIYGDPLFNCAPRCDLRGGGYAVDIVSAPNPDLRPQTSKQQAYSASWRPGGFAEGLSIDISYNRTRIRDEFASAQRDLPQFLPNVEAYKLPQFYVRDATGRIVQFRNQIFNISGSEYESMTYEVGYMLGTGIGTFEPKIVYVDNMTARRQAFSNSTPISTLGTLNGVDDYRIVGSLGWYFHDFTAQIWAYHTPSYINDYVVDTFGGIVSNPDYAKHVDSYTTFDLTASWRVNNKLRLNFAGRNIFDADPPFVVVDDRPYDVGRYNPAGRTLSLEAQVSF